MPQIYLMRASTEAMESHKHRLVVVRGERCELLLAKERCPWRQTRWLSEFPCLVSEFALWRHVVRLDHKVNCVVASEHGTVGIEDLPLIVDRDIIMFHHCPGRLQMAVEQEWIEMTCFGSCIKTDIHEGHLFLFARLAGALSQEEFIVFGMEK